MSKISLGIILANDYQGWIGGQYYYDGLINAIRTADDSHSIELVGIYFESPELKPEKLDRIITFKTREPEKNKYADNYFVKKINYYIHRVKEKLHIAQNEQIDDQFGKFLLENNIDIVFGHNLPDNTLVPSMFWVPDLQVLHYPENFQNAEALKIHLINKCQKATYLIATSDSVADDYMLLYPDAEEKVIKMPFSISMSDVAFDLSVESVNRKFDLPDDYFYFPSRFWVHKNHHLVIDALNILEQQGKNITVVCSGDVTDHRDLSFISKLIYKVNSLRLRKQFIILGMVEKEELFALIRGSRAVLMPSLFQAWNTVVEECKYFGTPIIVSDIDTHKEQAKDYGIFIDRFDPVDLAEKMLHILSHTELLTEDQQQLNAMQYNIGFKAYGNKWINLLESIINQSGANNE